MNHKYFAKNSPNTKRIKHFKLNSEIKPLSYIYEIWIDLITLEGKKVYNITYLSKIQCEKLLINSTDFYDERGNLLKTKLTDNFAKNLINSFQMIYSGLE